MQYIIDRFEGPYAVCEGPDKKMVNLLRRELPVEAQEGNRIEKQGDYYVIVQNEEDRERIKRKMKDLFGE